MKVNIISKPNQELKYLDPNFDKTDIPEDDWEYIYCEDFFNTGQADDYGANHIFDYDYETGIVTFNFDGTEGELKEICEESDGSADVWDIYERIEKFAEGFKIEWELCEFIDDSGENWAE